MDWKNVHFLWWWWLLLTLVHIRERRKGGKCRGSMKDFEGRRRGMLRTATCCTMCKRGWVRIRHDRLENGGYGLGQHPGRGYTGGQRSLILLDALPSGHSFSRLIRHAGKRWAYPIPHPQSPGNTRGFIDRYKCIQCIYILHNKNKVSESNAHINSEYPRQSDMQDGSVDLQRHAV